eukprot:TRINITY_DN104153_c0_g1_i1.p1 TRINITY_DN104153_c0_g1~~TRINITY_DN104153_c0_g1_i1.p1  ORF type:complete len:210 (+),score=19.61 TRINITY_DN104153_c0_g1_i1:89-718(+)
MNTITFTVFACILATCAALSCTPTPGKGCINGVPFNQKTQMVCGRTHGSEQPIYNTSEFGCCDQGIPFNRTTSYCCYSRVQSFKIGKCQPWNSTVPEHCSCESPQPLSAEEVTEQIKTQPDGPAKPVNTLLPNPHACLTANSTDGCLNGWPYSWGTQQPCGNWLVGFSYSGCCDGVPYSYFTQSCCFFNGAYKVLQGGRACDCIKYGCM